MFLAVLVALCALAIWALWIEPRRGVVRRRTLRLPHWPATLDGLIVALVGDLHAGAPHVDADRVRRLVAAVNRRRPELVLLAGDFVDDEVAGAERVPPEDVGAALAALRAPLGVYAVLGNHDRAFGAGRVAAALREQGIDVLDGDKRQLSRRLQPLWLAGVAGMDDEPRSADAALAGIPEGAPVILLAHEPDLFPRVPERVSLTVAGHTHGGQVALPGLRSRWIPSRFGERYAGGHVIEGGRHLYITTGVGTSRWPVRVGAPPEVVLLKLRPARPDARRGGARRHRPAGTR